MIDFVQVTTATDSVEVAQAIANHLVTHRLAACVHIVGPIQSTYRWEGAVETAQEWVCVVKSRRECYAAIEEVIREIHPYHVPAILATPVLGGSAPYLEWLAEQTSPPTGPSPCMPS